MNELSNAKKRSFLLLIMVIFNKYEINPIHKYFFVLSLRDLQMTFMLLVPYFH